MFSSLRSLSHRSPRQSRGEPSPFPSPLGATGSTPAPKRDQRVLRRRIAADYDDETSAEDDEDEDAQEQEEEEDNVDNEEDAGEDESDEDGRGDAIPLLPIFSAAHLDALPVYNLTHTVRLLVIGRCDTTLSWEQLRSPQVSQFLLKPIQQELLSSRLSAATEYALMANCLQFTKEVSLNPGNSGANRTRAMVCELLAIKLLRDYSTRELIDALSYDFDPLQGQLPAIGGPEHAMHTPKTQWDQSRKPRSARVSCLEVAIRAQAKRFLAHPLVVQHLEAIWSGSIVFHSAADNLHRQPKKIASYESRAYGTLKSSAHKDYGRGLPRAPSRLPPANQRNGKEDVDTTQRRTVTLYNPRDASLFKLSRLRVPRYRNLLSTCSFSVLLGLFLAVLIQRSLHITPLEIVFWFWAAGYMLDELIGFNEQGFSLYLASFWNTFDVGILLVLFVHLGLRFYGIVMPDVKKHSVANMAYDVLAADAILLFPRLFSVLDHYRYFSQLLIAFRMMATDLMAIFVLIIVSCSGFFVALTLSFGNEGIDTPGSVAYALLQILMGFTPAAWDRWDGYNALGKTILTLFLFICHFLVVTILITVLTNSFMAIVQNANEEHQFVFAVNTISMIKSDALFSYVAPTNILAWILTPLRYCIPLRTYVKLNRTAIKVTHFPILFLIYAYEKTILQASVIDPTDVIEPRGRGKRLFTPRIPRRREGSVVTHRQDRALEEVFRQPFDSTMRKSQHSVERRKASNVVSSWMKTVNEEVTSPPPEQDKSILERLENRRTSSRRLRMLSKAREGTFRTRSIASDPEEFRGTDVLSPSAFPLSSNEPTPSNPDGPIQETDADGDDELVTNENEDTTTLDRSRSIADDQWDQFPQTVKQSDYFSHMHSPRARAPDPGSPVSSSQRDRAMRSPASGRPSPRRRSPTNRPTHHLRNVSNATMVFRPVEESSNDQSSSHQDLLRPRAALRVATSQPSNPPSGVHTPNSKPTSSAASRRALKRPLTGQAKLKPGAPSKNELAFQSTPNLAGLMHPKPTRPKDPRRTSLDMDLVSDIGDNKAIGGGYVGAIPASFAAQMALAAGTGKRNQDRKDDQEMYSRIMMSRMNTLEEGFREVVHEMRDHLRREQESRSASGDRTGRRYLPQPPQKGKGRQRNTDDENVEADERPQDAKAHSDGGPTGAVQLSMSKDDAASL